MDSRPSYRVPVRWVIVVAAIAAVITGVLLVVAQDDEDDLGYDGRINFVHHFGGDALYCVDRDFNPTGQYSDDQFGGIRLLSQSGQALWFVPSEDITEATADLVPGGEKVLIATGNGSYGPVALYGLLNSDGDLLFQFVGHDEHGKQNQMEFKFCDPVGPIPHPEGNPPDEPTDVPDFCEQFPNNPRCNGASTESNGTSTESNGQVDAISPGASQLETTGSSNGDGSAG